MTLNRREPVPLGEALTDLGTRLGLGAPDERARLVDRWAEVVGPDAIDEVRPGAVRDGVLTLLVRDPVWAGQFRYRAEAVRDRVAEVLGPGVVREVRVRHLPERTPDPGR